MDAFNLWCWRILLRTTWITRRSNQSILKEINSEYSLKGLMLKLKLQYFDHLIQRANSLENTLMLGKIEGRRRRGWHRMGWVDGITDSMDMSLSKFWEIVKNREAWHDAIHGVKERQTWLGSWTITTSLILLFSAEKNLKYFHQIFSFLFFSELLYLSASFPFLLHGLSSNAYILIQRSGSWASSHCTVVIPEKYGLPLDFNYWNVVDLINYISSLELSPKVCILF